MAHTVALRGVWGGGSPPRRVVVAVVVVVAAVVVVVVPVFPKITTIFTVWLHGGMTV